MPRGLEALTLRGLEHPDRYPDMYWGGALFCLLADARVRRESGGARGLEDGVRAVFEAGGVSSEVWTLARATEVADRALGAPVLAELQAKYRDQGAPLDLNAFFRELGVTSGQKRDVRVDRDATHAALRKALVYGNRAR
jgi:predicted metalloprotease with PDZ domain